MTDPAGVARWRRELHAARWRNLAALGLLVGASGYLVAGIVGGVVGVVGGVVAARKPRVVLLAAAIALYATAAFTVLEQPLTESRIPVFPVNHPVAEFSAKVAAVLLLAGLFGVAGARLRRRVSDDGPPHAAPGSLPQASSGATPRVPASTIGALVAAALLATLALWQLGDRRWEAAALPIAIGTLLLGAAAVSAERLRVLQTLWRDQKAMLGGLRREHPHLLGGSAWLLAATVAVSLGSFVFWLLVTQRTPADDVGRAAALFSASLFVSYLTSLGLPIAVSRYATDRSQSSATLFAWSLVLSIAASVVGVALLIALAPQSIRDGLDGWQPGFAWLVVFVLVASQSVAALVDVRLMVLRRWSLVFARSFLIAAVRLPFLLWIPASGAAFYTYMVALGGFALTGVVFLVPLARRGWLRLRPLPTRARRAVRFAGVNYLGWLAVQAPFFAVPVVVLVQVSAVENARFYLSWGVMSVVYVGIQMIGQVLLVEGGRDGADHRRQAAVSLGAGLALATAGTLVSLGLGPLLASLYGPEYGPVATLLPLLVAGTIPFAVTMTLLTTARIREHSNSTLAVTVGFAVAVLLPTLLLTASDGALGAAWGWTMGNTIAAALAFLVSRLPRRETGKRERRETEAPLLTPVPGGQRGGRGG